MTLTIDHIVVGAGSLAQGREWARDVLGGEPLVGGRHAFMGTHNLVLRLDDAVGAAGPGAGGTELYLEILAIDPDEPAPGRARWFGLDEPGVRAALAAGPRLLAWVARSSELDADRERLLAAGADPGPVFAATRDTPTGELRWRITIREDGARLGGGAVPTLIAWDTPSPAASLPAGGVSLERLAVRGVGGEVAAMLSAAGARVEEGVGPALLVVLRAPGVLAELEVV